MKHFINLKDIPAYDLRKILIDAKKRKKSRGKLNTLDVDLDQPLKGKLFIQMYEKQSSRTRLSFLIAIKQFNKYSKLMKSKNIKVVNLSRESWLDMFEKKDFNNIVK